MHTSKISLPPIKQMLGDMTGKEESSSGVYKYSLRNQDNQLIHHQQTTLLAKHSNSGTYTFDSWHECLSPQSLSPGLQNCQCATNRMETTDALSISASLSTNKYAYQHHNPPTQSPQYQQNLQYHHPHENRSPYPDLPCNQHRSSHRHRRAYSASTFVHPSSYLQASGTSTSSNLYQLGSPNRICIPTATHPTFMNNGTSVLYRRRARAHTTSGYLPTPNLEYSPSPTKSSSSMDMTPGVNAMTHEEEHTSSQPHQQHHRYHCPHCRKTFSRPSSLRIHIYSHTGEKPHVCPYFDCQRRFSVQSNMRRHIRVHTGNSNSTTLLRGERQSHSNDDHLDVSPARPIYQQRPNSPSYYPASNLMLHGH